jgi:beta-glucosidase
MRKFPTDFVWGASTSSYQIEGAWLEGNKGFSIWDAFCHIPGKIKNNGTGDVACNHYHRFREDIKLMAEVGLQAYRFSISWPRIQPTGRGKPNPEGLRFYSELIDTLLAHHITPWITLYHWDLPLALQLEYDGWLNPKLANFFADYAAICFESFGDRVKHWLTLNEPWCSAVLGHGLGIHAPGRISHDEPYRAGHTLLRAHALAVERYRTQFQPHQKGFIALSNNCDWREPLTGSDADKQAAQRAVEFFLGWFADPIYKGDYPTVMRERLGDRLPHFTDVEKTLLKGSTDFFGLNHYSTMYAANATIVEGSNHVYDQSGIAMDQGVILSADPHWEKTEMQWHIVPVFANC